MSTYANFPYQRQFDQFIAANLRDSVDNMMGIRTGRNFRKRQRLSNSIQDNTSYQQWKKYKIRDGRWRNALIPSLKSNLYRQDYTFKRLKVFQGRGDVVMEQTQLVDNHCSMPIYTLALNGVKQVRVDDSGTVSSVSVAKPFRNYVRQSDGTWKSYIVNGQQQDGVSGSGLEDPSTRLEDSGAMGPSGFLKWTSVKFNLWGARKRQTIFYVDIVRATEQHGCPYAYGHGSVLPAELGQHLDEIMRPLTVNPIAAANNLVRSPWKVLKRIKVELDPVLSTEGDPDGHVKTVELFNRWGRTVRFDRAIDDSDSLVTNQQFEIPAAGIRDDVKNVIHTFPEATSLLFVVIRCNQFVKSAIGTQFDPDIHASFDISFRSSWSKIQ